MSQKDKNEKLRKQVIELTYLSEERKQIINRLKRSILIRDQTIYDQEQTIYKQDKIIESVCENAAEIQAEMQKEIDSLRHELKVANEHLNEKRYVVTYTLEA